MRVLCEELELEEDDRKARLKIVSTLNELFEQFFAGEVIWKVLCEVFFSPLSIKVQKGKMLNYHCNVHALVPARMS